MFKYIAMVFAGACSFGILSTFVKLAYREGYTAAELTVSQAFVSMLVLWAWSWINRRANPGDRVHLRDTRTWLYLICVGMAMGLTTYVYYLSVKYIPASLAVVILMQFTWMGTLLEWLFLKRRPGRLQVIVMAAILLGTVPASGLMEADLQRISPWGIALALASALLYAVYVVANSRKLPPISSSGKTAMIMAGYLLGIILANGNQLILHNHFDQGLIKWVAFFGVFGTLVPQVLLAKGIPHVGAGISSIIMTAELPVAVLAAHIVLGEPVSALQWVGLGAMLLAMAFMKKPE